MARSVFLKAHSRSFVSDEAEKPRGVYEVVQGKDYGNLGRIVW